MEKLHAHDDPGAPYEPHRRAVRSRSNGYAQRVPGSTCKRLHDLLSRGELYCFLLFDWAADEYRNIREKFALPLELTQAVARQHGWKHPRDGWTKSDAILCVDFLLSRRGGGWLGVDFVPSKFATKKSVIARNALAKQVLSVAGVEHVVMTEFDIPQVVVRNYRWLRIHRLGVDTPPLPLAEIHQLAPRLRAELMDGKTEIFEAAQRVAIVDGLSAGLLARTCYWLIANRLWLVDFTRPIGPDYAVRFTH